MKIIIRNPNDDTNAKFKLKALADGIITVNAPAGAIIKNEDNEWLTCLSAASTLISCAGASNKLFVPYDFTPHIADRPAGLESFWDWSLNGGYGDTPSGAWEAVSDTMYADDKIVNWDVYVDEIKIGSTFTVPLSRRQEGSPGFDPDEMDIWFGEILSKVSGLKHYYADAVNNDETDPKIASFFNSIVAVDGVDVVMPHRTIRALIGVILVNENDKPLRIKLVPNYATATTGTRWVAHYGMRPSTPQENYAYLLDLQPLAETMRGNDAVTVDPVDGSISICLEAAPKVISCAGASTTFELRSDLSSRTTEIQVNDGAWVDLFETIDGLSVTFQPNNPGALLTLSNTSGEDMRIRLRASKDFGLYVNSDGEENLRTNMVEQSNQAYTLYDADGNVIDPRLESNKDYSGRDFDDTGTNNDYAIYFRTAEFCLAAVMEIPLISCAGAGSILDLRIRLHRNESGGAVYINDPITGDRIADGFGYYADAVKSVAELLTVTDEWKDKLEIVNNGNLYYNDNFTLESSVGIINKTDEPLRLEIICKTMSPSDVTDPTLTSMHVADSTNAITDEIYGDDIDTVNVCIAPLEVIEAEYNPFYQQITVMGKPDTYITTQDENGNVLGNGNITSDGTLEYFIDEDMLAGGAKIITSGMGTTAVEHNLVASLYVASDVEGQNVEFNVVRDNHLDWLRDYAGYEQGLSATLEGEMIVEYSTGERTIVFLDEHRGKRWGFIVDELGVHDYNTAGTAKTGLVSAKVRFRNLNDKVHVVLAQATHVYKFFDDGLSEVSYSLVSRDSRPYVKLKQIPTYLPSTMRSLNTMFWGDGNDSYVFENATVEAALANWDVSNIISMSSTFAYGMYHSLPIGNWTPTNLKYMTGTFGYATWDTAIDWTTPALLDTSFAFEGSTFNNTLKLSMGQVIKAECMFIDNMTFTQNISNWCVTNLTVEPMDFNTGGVLTPEKMPVWGTCPSGT